MQTWRKEGLGPGEQRALRGAPLARMHGAVRLQPGGAATVPAPSAAQASCCLARRVTTCVSLHACSTLQSQRLPPAAIPAALPCGKAIIAPFCSPPVQVPTS